MHKRGLGDHLLINNIIYGSSQQLGANDEINWHITTAKIYKHSPERQKYQG